MQWIRSGESCLLLITVITVSNICLASPCLVSRHLLWTFLSPFSESIKLHWSSLSVTLNTQIGVRGERTREFNDWQVGGLFFSCSSSPRWAGNQSPDSSSLTPGWGPTSILTIRPCAAVQAAVYMLMLDSDKHARTTTHLLLYCWFLILTPDQSDKKSLLTESFVVFFVL